MELKRTRIFSWKHGNMSWKSFQVVTDNWFFLKFEKFRKLKSSEVSSFGSLLYYYRDNKIDWRHHPAPKSIQIILKIKSFVEHVCNPVDKHQCTEGSNAYLKMESFKMNHHFRRRNRKKPSESHFHSCFIFVWSCIIDKWVNDTIRRCQFN